MKAIKLILAPILAILLVFAYNEYFIYYHKLFHCTWPKNPKNSIDNANKLINLMLISDTHLLGSRQGHWFDKLRREWQQHRAYQTARYYLEPDYIVIMGDVTDEGKWCSDWEWQYYENRVKELFYTKDNESSKRKTELIIIAGNHDMGFHYDMINRKVERFNKSFNGQFVNLYQPKERNDVNFLTVNSMALENDRCKFCQAAQRQLKSINKTLNCLKLKTENNESYKSKCFKYKEKDEIKNKFYSRPILFTHFPLYRKSDSLCPNDIDSENFANKGHKLPQFKENFDCLSQEATNQIIKLMNPRLVFNGHTHFSCYNEVHGVPEYTLTSFSWRNMQTPSMLLLQINKDEHFISKCYLPSEVNVLKLYAIVIVLSVIFYFYLVYKHISGRFYKKKCFQSLGAEKIE